MSKAPSRILVVDDEKEIRWLLCELIEKEGMAAVEAPDGATALGIIQSASVDAILLDIRMPGMDGHALLSRMRQLDLDVPAIILTAYGTIPDAVEAVKQGAFWYLTKPCDHRELLSVIHQALREGRRRRKQKEPLHEQFSLLETMGQSEAILRLAAEVARVAPTDYSVMILGETGVGKEVVARAIHLSSRRASREFVAVDSGAIPETLIESELFGNERGAFTGADRRRAGKFEVACGGTLFLDEISNLPLGMQSKLLRALQERTFYRLGGTTPIEADARVLAATNQMLTDRSGAAAVRADLYHRLSEYVIHVPPLRERRQDIAYLARRFLEETNEELGKRVDGFAESALDLLFAHDWPGNVRELRNAIRRAALLADEAVEAGHLSAVIPVPSLQPPAVQPEPPPLGTLPLRALLARHTATLERELISQALHVARGNKAKAARLLQVDYKTIHTKVKRYRISEGGTHDD